MRDAISVVTSVLLSFGAVVSARADATWEYAVQASAVGQASPAEITLSWPQDVLGTPSSYTVYRKSESGTAWGQGTTLPGTATNYTDKNIKVGTAYEYEVVKSTAQYTGYGYVYAGINVPMTDARGKLLLVVDDTYATDLATELSQLQQDLTGDGWSVVRLDVHRTDSVTSVKQLIKSHYQADPKNVKGVFLFGHVPVPYSGDIVPDGHVPDHQGAWPCDGFYGDMEGVWTDNKVDDTSGTYDRNHNVPGDGKFDQSTFPAPLKLMVGRVDLANLPGRLTYGGPATFPSELELLRNYLNKDHAFRTRQFDLPRRGIVGDYFGVRDGEAFAASGWRNFAGFVGADNVTTLPNEGTWLSTLSANQYLWAYGCGPGSFTSIGGIGTSGQYNDGTTTDLVAADPKAVFTLLFGSWLGDWDSEDNLMRAVLACPSYALTSGWSGRPHWFLHRMALGEPIGAGALLTQNNGPHGLFKTEVNSAAGQIHIALMGDPTLRMHVVAPPADLARSGSGKTASLSWTASADSVLGYHVYRAANPSGPFKRLTTSPIAATQYTDRTSSAGAVYMVRAEKLETSGSGTYYNLSQGAFVATKELAVSGPTGSATGQPGKASTKAAPITVPGSPGLGTNAISASTNAPVADTSLASGSVASADASVVPAATSRESAAAQDSLGPVKSTALDSQDAPTGPKPEIVSVVDYTTPELPAVGESALHVLTPNLLELQLINTKQLDAAAVGQWNFVDGGGNFSAPPAGAFSVTVSGHPVAVTAIGFKRRPLYAPLTSYDLRIENCLYLQLAAPIADDQEVEVTNPDGSLWAASTRFTTTVDPLRYSPAIHVNQEGYSPTFPKKAMVGYYVGSFGELLIPTGGGFKLVNASTGKSVFQGKLVQRTDSGYTYSPAPYQQVFEADFSSFKGTGEFRLVVPGMGASLPFLINHGVPMAFARSYALGLYHQRCGTDTAMPFTRFTHGKCHTAPVAVPSSADAFPFTWGKIAEYANTVNANNPPQIAPALTSPSAQLFPFINQGPLDVSGGHHDAGDYSKYTINSASLIHYLMFAVDSLPGVARFDNLGIPESGDGKSDVVQEAKWEADYLAKMQDSDGGFYFLVYPQTREYEGDVTPDHGDPQLVWPKTTSVTAASVAALAQCASSPTFKKAYPKEAKLYMQKAQLGWQFLMNAINKYGKNGAYQKITHYGDDFADNDELAWAACQMYLATGDDSVHKLLLSWFNPADPATWRWGWIHMSQCYGHAIRSYAFALQSHRVADAKALDASFLAKCQAEIAAAGDAVLQWSQASAYGTSFPPETKAVNSAGWYFSADQAFDLAVAYQLNDKAEYLDAMLANMNYEGGCNPVNVTYVTGLGWKKPRDIVSQWHVNDKRALPPSGLPVGNIQDGFSYLNTYGSELGELCFPSDGASPPYPSYDRWGDSWNVSTEMVVLNSARALGTLGFLAAKAGGNTGHWKPTAGKIKVPAAAKVGSAVTVSLQAANLAGARVTWEARDQEPAYGPTFTFSPKNSGPQWVEAEAQMPDGKRAFAQASFNAE